LIIGEMQSKLATWSTQNRGRKFDRLLRLIADGTWLAEAARITLASDGARTPGVDGVDKQIMERNLHDELATIRVELMAGTYTPLPARRVYIPKPNGKLRPLGIPSLRDRIVQRAMLMAMEPIWESDFHCASYGFRPARSVHHAIRALKLQLQDGGEQSVAGAGSLRAISPATLIPCITDCYSRVCASASPISASLPCFGSLSRRAVLIEVYFVPPAKGFLRAGSFRPCCPTSCCMSSMRGWKRTT